MSTCPHCGRELTEFEANFGDFSGCPRTPPCPPKTTKLDPRCAWPFPGQDDDDDGTEDATPAQPLEGVGA